MSSLRLRVALAAVAAAGLVIAVAAGILFATAGRDERRDLDRDLDRQAREIGPSLFLGGPLGPPENEPNFLPGGDQFVRVSRAGATVVEAGDGPEGGELPGQAREGFETFEVGDETWRSYTFAPTRPIAPQIQVATSLEPLERRVANRRRLVVLLGLAGLGAAGGLGFAFGGVALRPLRRLRDAAAGVGSTRDLDARVPAEGPEEVAALADSLNAMLARLEVQVSRTEAALEASRRFAADAGHELRTPLTSMSANVDAIARNPEMAPDERGHALAGVRSELARFADVLDALQDLARGDAGVGQPPEELDLAELADAATASARLRHPELELSVKAEDGGVSYTGSPAGLRLVLDNLVENAAVHGGRRVGLTVERKPGSGARVTVDDDGPGVPVPERERVLGRFERGQGAAGAGSGLGLAIVAQQAARHGGSVRIEDGPLDGARVVVELA